MNAPAGSPPQEMLTAYLRTLRRRAFALYGLRAACAAAGATGLALTVIGSVSGPVVTPLVSRITLALLGLLACAILLLLLRPLATLRGLGGCNLLAQREPVLASRMRSALELHGSAGSHASPALVAAHARLVRDALVLVPAASVVPLRGLRHPAVYAGICCALLSAALWIGSDAARSGALALLSPAEVRPDGLRVAPVIESISVQLVYPSYLGMPSARLSNPLEIAAPRGTTIELTATPRLPARQGSLRLGSQQVRMSSAPNGQLFARFVVRESSELGLRIHSNRHWYEDSARRQLRAIADAPPTIKLELPHASTTVEAHEPIAMRYVAADDHGLQAIDLVVRSQAGDEQRRRLWSSPNEGKSQARLIDDVLFTPDELGAQAGDVLLVWLEARDGDVVGGPNVGISKPVSIEVATDAQQLSLKLPLLREVLDGALDALADRIETPVPEQPAQAGQRWSELHDGEDRWLSALQALILASRKHVREAGLDLDQLQGVLDRTRRELAREGALYRGNGTRARKALLDADAKLVAGHERDVLLLADMLAQALVDEARALTQELSDLKSHIRELLQQLKRENSPEAQRALLSEIAKAQRRMRELAQSLARLSNRVPSEFINREALPQSGAKDTLDELRAAVESGDLDSAERQLAQLEQEIDQLAQNIESGGNRFREAHFGARDKSLAEAQQQLQALGEEQARLAERTRDVLERTTERAKARSGSKGPSAEMQQAASDLERELGGLGEASPGSPERPWLDRARERMRDAADAMRTGDMSEARRMAQAAGNSLEQVASSLEQDARMFPGHDGETWDRAQAARAAADKLRKLNDQLDRSLPQLGEHVGEGERRQLRADVDPQRKAREQADALGGKLGQSGEQEAPLSPQAENELSDAAEAMRRAERALDRGDPQSAAMAQDEANDRIKQVEQRLRERGQQRAQPSRGRREGGDGGQMARPEGPVRIPRADEFSGPMQMRRRLLDAMREAPPPEYEGAVGRYYEELLR